MSSAADRQQTGQQTVNTVFMSDVAGHERCELSLTMVGNAASANLYAASLWHAHAGSSALRYWSGVGWTRCAASLPRAPVDLRVVDVHHVRGAGLQSALRDEAVLRRKLADKREPQRLQPCRKLRL